MNSKIQINATPHTIVRFPVLNVSSSTPNADSAASAGLQPLLIALLIVLLLLGLYHIVSGHLRGLHNGYEKLVMPLLARLSSNNSLASENMGENSAKEFVWLPRAQLDNMSVGEWLNMMIYWS